MEGIDVRRAGLLLPVVLCTLFRAYYGSKPSNSQGSPYYVVTWQFVLVRLPRYTVSISSSS